MTLSIPLSITFAHTPQVYAPTPEAAALLRSGAVLAFGHTCRWHDDKCPSWDSDTAVCVHTPEGDQWVRTWEAMKALGIPGLSDAILSMTHPEIIDPWAIKRWWKYRHRQHDEQSVLAVFVDQGLWLRAESPWAHHGHHETTDAGLCVAVQPSSASAHAQLDIHTTIQASLGSYARTLCAHDSSGNIVPIPDAIVVPPSHQEVADLCTALIDAEHRRTPR